MIMMADARWPAALGLAAVLAAAGCAVITPTGGSGSGNARNDLGISEYYLPGPYTGPLQQGRAYQTIEQITFTQQGGDFDPAVSPDGKWLIFASTRHSPIPDIYMKSMSGTAVTRLTNTPAAEIQPCFNPDGRLFAYASNARGNWDIYIEPVEGSKGPTCLTRAMGTDEISPNWHPGGDWIAFSSFSLRTWQWEIVVRNIRTGQVRYLGEGLYPKFSPDGRRIAFQRARDREPRWFSIWVIEIDEEFNVGAPTEIVESAKWAAINPAWSPDGKYLAFATVHESPLAQSTRRILMGDDICVVNRNGQAFTNLTSSPEPDSHPFWARAKDGRNGRICFVSMRAGPKNVWALNPTLPEPYGSVSGPLPGPAPENPPPAAPARKPEPPESAPEKPPAAPKAEAPKAPELPPPATAKPE